MSEKVQGKHLISMLSNGRLTVTKVSPCGSLYAKKRTSGVIVFYWRYTHADYSQLVEIGTYDSSAPPKSVSKTNLGFSITAAIRAAETLAQAHQENKSQGGYTAVKKSETLKKEILLESSDQGSQLTLEKLLMAYCAYLEKNEKKSHKDARNIFKKDVIRAWPTIAALPANEITSEQIADMLRLVHENGHARTSNKLRSYMRAAYQVAKSAKNKASIPALFKSFKVTNNPVADTEPDTGANQSDRNPLTVVEMQTYWNCIKSLSGLKGSVLRLHLLTGGLRIEQLVNLKTSNSNDNTITLYDIKGRAGKALSRPYITPLIPCAALDLKNCEPEGTFAISTDRGITHLSAITLSKWSRIAVGSKIPNFTAKRIRSGVETLLAKQKFSKDLRGRLQSHGISGVQDKHYDGHDYVDEKREMLEALFKTLCE